TDNHCFSCNAGQAKDGQRQSKRGPKTARQCRGPSRQSFWKKNTGLIRPKGGNEGVGEHVRTRFHRQQKALVKLRTFEKDPHRTKKAYFLRFFCRTGFEGADRLPKRDPAV